MSPSMPTREELRQIAEAVGPERKRGNGKDEQAETRLAEVEGPRPLRRELPPAEPFPITAFNCVPVLKAAIEAVEQKTRAPMAICGN